MLSQPTSKRWTIAHGLNIKLTFQTLNPRFPQKHGDQDGTEAKRNPGTG